MNGHTKEPWLLDAYLNVKVEGADRLRVHGFALSSGDEAEANTRRIVACVNACAGMTNDDLANVLTIKEQIGFAADHTTQYINDIKAERDDLLAASKALVEQAGKMAFAAGAGFVITDIDYERQDKLINAMNAAIAKVEEQS